MIRAMMFDLDGVVVQSEKLKAQAYAMTVQRLRGLSEPDPRAIEAYRTIVGASREVAAQFVNWAWSRISGPSARAVIAATTNLRAPVMTQTSEGAVKHAGFGSRGEHSS